jgi:hypothetical protein
MPGKASGVAQDASASAGDSTAYLSLSGLAQRRRRQFGQHNLALRALPTLGLTAGSDLGPPVDTEAHTRHAQQLPQGRFVQRFPQSRRLIGARRGLHQDEQTVSHGGNIHDVE